MNLTASMRIPAIKSSMKSIESGGLGIVSGMVHVDMVFEPCGDAPSTWDVFWREMALHMPSHVPDPISVVEMGDADPPHP